MAAPSPAAPAAPAPRAARRWRSLARRAASAAPERVTLATVALAISCGATVSLGVFHPWTALPIAVALSWLGWRFLAPGPRDGRAALGGGIITGYALAWTLANAPWVAEYLIVRRDPGFLTLTGLWLVNHGSSDIPTAGALEAAAVHPTALADASQAWNLRGDQIQPQGAKLLPALIAVGGWVAGLPGVLAANLVVGAVGILATYVVARRLLGPIAALAPAIGLSLTASHFTLSRAAYTEPVTMLLLLAAIAWAWDGVRNLHFPSLAGAAVASGATFLVRVDGPLFALGVALGVAIALAVPSNDSRAKRAEFVAAFVVIQAAMVVAGHASIWRWSRDYVRRLGDESALLEKGYFACAAVIVVVAVAVVFVPLPKRQERAAPLWWAPVASVGMVGLLAGLSTRPRWMTAHTPGDSTSSFHDRVVAAWQGFQGLPVDGTRTYAESTITWVSLYVSWPVILLGIAGFGYVTWRWARGEREWVVVLAGVLVPSLLYVWRPAIMPDQVWAIRRLAPDLVVGLLVAAGVAAAAAGRAYASRRGADPSVARALARTLALVVLIGPVASLFGTGGTGESGPRPTSLLLGIEQGGAREQVEALCDYVDHRPVVLVGTASHFGTVRVACDVPVVLTLNGITAPELATMAAIWGQLPVVLTEHPEQVPWIEAPELPTLESRVYFSESSIARLPLSAARSDYSWYVGEVEFDGRVAWVAPRNADRAT